MMVNLRVLVIVALTEALFPRPAVATASGGQWQGKVVGVADGDTITVLRDQRPIKVRLHGIDAPEKNQPFGKKAKRFMSKLVFGRVVKIKVAATDRYGRTVGEVFIGARSANEAIVKAGLAWWYRKYARRAKVLALLEEQAKKGKRGLWSQAKPVPPWKFRHRGKGLRCNTQSRVCHRPGCRHYRCRNCTRRLRSVSAAKKAGYRFHPACNGR